ncbi:2-hydroxy-3-oxopropionate reductase (plasmid) [Sphingobium sp. EP60837]|nr:NAD(P)-dependent oxidoreductase [Sphingobium sp. EP60837]ANI80101.1 2-hydroxy-3-oxopropionate reductase [Sphingobium sp. EP60837]
MKVGFIGLGRMGSGMALNLLKTGHDLTIFDTNPDAVAVLTSAGAKSAASVGELAGQVDVLFTSLPGPPEVEAVVLGEGGVVANMREGLVLFELSTSSRDLAKRIDEAMRAHRGQALDAPVSGGPAGAAGGDLAFWVGGERATFDRYASVLAAMGDKACYMGPAGTGIVTKLVNNLLGQMALSCMAEVFSMGVKAGIDPLDLWEALKLGVVGKQSIIQMLVKQFLPGNYDEPAFAMKLGHKDVALATGMARELGVPMRLSNLVMEEMTEALARGWGDRDTRVHMSLQLERAGVQIAVDPDRLACAIP